MSAEPVKRVRRFFVMCSRGGVRLSRDSFMHSREDIDLLCYAQGRSPERIRASANSRISERSQEAKNRFAEIKCVKRFGFIVNLDEFVWFDRLVLLLVLLF